MRVQLIAAPHCRNRQVLRCVQVFQLPKQKPDKVLKAIWGNLDAAIKEGDEKAEHIQNNMRVVAAGGDGTYSWLLQAIGCAPCLCSSSQLACI